MFAPGGSGKTFVFNMIANYLCQNQYKISCAAWTGIAATLLTEGCTVHSLFKLPVPVVDTSSCNVLPTSQHANVLRNQNIFIIDEASMIPTHALDAIDRILQETLCYLVEILDKFSLLYLVNSMATFSANKTNTEDANKPRKA